MLKRLKVKFIAIVMTLVGLVLVASLAISLYSSYSSQRNIIIGALERNLAGDIDSVPTIGAPQRDREGGGDRGRNMLALGVLVSSDGVILQTSERLAILASASRETERRRRPSILRSRTGLPSAESALRRMSAYTLPDASDDCTLSLTRSNSAASAKSRGCGKSGASSGSPQKAAKAKRAMQTESINLI